MIIRRYIKSDIPAMVLLLKDGLENFHYRKVQYSHNKISDLLHAKLKNPEFFCHVMVEDDGEITGVLAGGIYEYLFSYEVFAECLITYIREGHGSLKGITGLVAAYKQWAIKMGARQIRWGQSTGYKMDKFAKLATRLGFTQMGTNWLMETDK